MAYKRVVILGGGPVGLLCAIEAKQQNFREVTIVEKRGAYTRLNVPQLSPELKKHLEGIEGMPKMKHAYGGASFSQIESPLLKKALSMGVILLRPYLVKGLRGSSEMRNARYKHIVLTVQQCEPDGKQVTKTSVPREIKANLLIVATGGGAAEDPLITKTLGFDYQKLSSESYMAYGIFKKSKPVGEPEVTNEVSNAYESIARRGGICFKTADYQYMLSSLSGISRSDFELLKKDQKLLEELIVSLKRADTKTTGVREEIKEVKNKLYAFKVDIQRARQLVSHTYPAVLVGDSAVTPHPDTGMGYAAGFRGYQEVKTLLEKLAKSTQTGDDGAAFQSFNDLYEVAVSKKALEGTVAMCENNVGLLESYRSHLKQFRTESTSTLGKTFQMDLEIVDELIANLNIYREFAEYFKDYYTRQTQENWEPLHWIHGPSDLWDEMEVTWKIIDNITRHKPLLKPQLEALQKAIVVDEILPFSSL